jgi:hypothetical protein
MLLLSAVLFFPAFHTIDAAGRDATSAPGKPSVARSVGPANLETGRVSGPDHSPAFEFAHTGERGLLSAFEIGLDLFGSPSPDSILSSAPPADTRRSPGLAAAASLLLPGMGEWYAGEPGGGKYFVIAEGALWLTYLAFELYGNALRDDARSFAVARAGVNPAGKDDQFYVDVGNFLDVREYNEKQLRDREPDRLYDAAGGFAWSWSTDGDRAMFRDQRLSAETMFNNRKFVAAAIVINHLASAINAARLVISRNAAIEEALGEYRMETRILGGPMSAHGVLLTLTRTF